MIGILLISHGNLASGMADAASMFCGDNISQFDWLCLQKEDNPEDFGAKIDDKVAELDKGDGVVILADLYGGTPCNQSIFRLNDKVNVVPGMNLAMLVELLSVREFCEISVEQIIETGRDGIKNVKQLLAEVENDDF